jgi:hypothetical protein
MDQREEVEREILATLKRLLVVTERIHCQLYPKRLSRIGIFFTPELKSETGETPMTPPTPIAGPVILTTAGEVATASVLGFDQFGSPWTGTMPPVTFTSSDTSGAVITSVPNADGVTDTVTAVANGMANLTASLTTAEGLSVSDTETVTVAIGNPVGTPVLTSIKVAFA